MGSCFGHWGAVLPILSSKTAVFKGNIILKMTMGYFNYLGTCDLCLKKLHIPRILIDFLVYSLLGSQL
jgi:hypothetical protein